MVTKRKYPNENPQEILISNLKDSWPHSVLLFTVRAAKKFKPGIQRSILLPLLFGLPLWFWYLLLVWGNRETESFYSYPIILTVIWVTLSPSLITKANDTLLSFLVQTQSVMAESEWTEYKNDSLDLFYSNRFLCITPGLVIGLAAAAWLYSNSEGFSQQATAFLVADMIVGGFMASMGFWGVYVVYKVIHILLKYPVIIDAGHLDRYGGLSYIGQFLAKGTLLFYSGSLFIPFAVSIVQSISGKLGLLLTYGLLVLFVGAGLFIFIRSVFLIHDMVFQEKLRLDRKSQDTLDKLLQEYIINPREECNLSDVLRPVIYHQLSHKQTAEMRDYPYDLRTIFELAVSALLPVVIFLLDRYLRAG